MTTTNLPSPITPITRLLTAADFQRLADVPPEIEWFANLGNKSTRRAYEHALQDFMQFTSIVQPEEFRNITRANVIAWRDALVRRALNGMTIRHRLAALSSLFEYLSEKNTVTHNPVKGVKRPAVEGYDGKTTALGDHQADVAKVQEWLGHANIATIRIYDHRKTRPEDSPTFKVTY